MKKILLIAALILTLSACSQNEESANTPTTEQTAEQETETEEKEVKEEPKKETVQETEESEYGKRTLIKRNDNLNIEKTTGPFIVRITHAEIVKVEPSEQTKPMFENKDQVTTVSITVEAENTTEDTNSFYPNQGTITTNTQEQKDADLFFSGDVGGDFIGPVKKKENVIFVLDSAPEEIESIKYIIGVPYNSNYDSIGEELTFEIDF